MNLLQIGLAGLIAVGIPGVFLAVIYMLDLYASRTFRLVLLCFFWGAIGGLGLSFVFNTYVAFPVIEALGWSEVLLYVAFAPVAEEVFKSLSLLYVSRRSEFTYFVDGAIYGFAAGIGFSIVENFIYIQRNLDQAIGLALVRAFSTCLMHGAAAGLVGVAVGRFRFQKRSGRWLGLLGGWMAAILLHALFNSISQLLSEGLVPIVGVGTGLLGVGLIAYFITLGVREQRQWFAETLDRKMGVTGAEVRAAQALSTIEEVVQPIARQFPAKAEQVQALLLSQAQMGIKRKVQQKVDDLKLQEQLGEEIAQLQVEMERLRKEIGSYVMTYVRMVFPEGGMDVWAGLARDFQPTDVAAWTNLLKPATEGPSGRSIFGSAGSALGGDAADVEAKEPPRQD